MCATDVKMGAMMVKVTSRPMFSGTGFPTVLLWHNNLGSMDTNTHIHTVFAQYTREGRESQGAS